MKILQFQKPEVSFFELDTPYKNMFYKKMAISFALFVAMAILAINSKVYMGILFCFIILLGYYASLFYDIYLSVTNQILFLEGKCIEIEKNEYNTGGFINFGFSTCKIILENDNGLKIIQSVPTINKYKEGNVVRIYYKNNTMNIVNNNTITIINPVFMHTLTS